MEEIGIKRILRKKYSKIWKDLFYHMNISHCTVRCTIRYTIEKETFFLLYSIFLIVYYQSFFFYLHSYWSQINRFTGLVGGRSHSSYTRNSFFLSRSFCFARWVNQCRTHSRYSRWSHTVGVNIARIFQSDIFISPAEGPRLDYKINILSLKPLSYITGDTSNRSKHWKTQAVYWIE